MRLCVTEAAIDAMSLAAFEGLRQGSVYLSTGGGWAPATEAAVRRSAARPGAVLVAATDSNSQGETFAGRLRDIADEVGCDWLRLTPPTEDWNDALKVRGEEMREWTMRAGRGGLPHARRSRQG
jgi:predicted nuclease with TOPRIM domain